MTIVKITRKVDKTLAKWSIIFVIEKVTMPISIVISSQKTSVSFGKLHINDQT